jgi:4-carboxymuconolactone decarboxylase
VLLKKFNSIQLINQFTLKRLKHKLCSLLFYRHDKSKNMSQQDFENGLKVRTEVMGESFVKRAQDNTVPFTQPLQDWINEHAWGSTWQREGVLPRKYRSLITIAFLTAQKSPTELKGHVRGALNNGATVEEIQEVLLHSLPYCGAPATQEAFRAALEVINDYQKSE